MKSSTLCALVALAALFARQAEAHLEPKADEEKCYGVAKAGRNDCASATGRHACATQAHKDSDPNEWILVPKRLCQRLAGGSLTPPK